MEDEWGFELDCAVAKAGKDALKRLKWLDSSRKSERTCGGLRVAFPITREGAFQLRSRGQEEDGLEAASLSGLGGSLVATGGFSTNHKFNSSPQHRLQKELSLLLQQEGLPQSLLRDLPTRWEKLGDLCIIPGSCFRDEAWSSFGRNLWEIVSRCLGVSRLARQAPIAATGTRDSRVEMLLGENGFVKHRENGISYCFDVTKCMFSSGNVTERSRMGELNCEGEVVVDLFAGIGYFVLPFLVKARASHVYACEWNPNAVSALRRNLEENAVHQRCIVLEGDNRIVAPQGVADRVCLGLLPSSEGSWAVALNALKPGGGALHIHENVKDSEEQQWIQYLLNWLQALATSQGRSEWRFSVLHLEHVKWYAPHIRHIVVDVKVQCQFGTHFLLRTEAS